VPYSAAVSPPRAKTFADRLPEVVEREERDISALSDEMAATVYPGRRRRRFDLGVVFETFKGPNYEPAVALARQASSYAEREVAGVTEHRAVFAPDKAEVFRELFRVLRSIPETKYEVNGKEVPLSRPIWPLLFAMLSGGLAWEPLSEDEEAS
jgi:hypothetical protein